MNYVAYPNVEDPKFLSIFRNRFRLPYPQYLELVAKAKTSPEYFRCWFDDSRNVSGESAAPLEILILSVLRGYLGRGWMFDDLGRIQEYMQRPIVNSSARSLNLEAPFYMHNMLKCQQEKCQQRSRDTK